MSLSMSRRALLASGAIALTASSARADTKRGFVDYSHGSMKLKGYVIDDESKPGKRPAIFMIHAREGMSPRMFEIAENWAKTGYVVFAMDMFGYGSGILPKTVEEMSAQTTLYSRDRELSRARMMAGFDTMLKNPRVDASKIGIVGYCFGGDMSTELVSTGLPVAANVTIHGSFRGRDAGWAKDVKSRFVILHGAEDKNYPLTTVTKVIDELRVQKKDFMLEVYSGTEHGFSTPKNKDEERANARSIVTASDQFKEMFGV